MNTFLPFIVVGLTTGAIYGLAATGLVLTYKTSGIFNLAHGATAAAAAYLFYWLHVDQDRSWQFAAVVGVVIFGPVAGLLVEWLSGYLAPQPIGLKIVATLGLVLIVQGLSAIKFGTDPLLVRQYLPRGAEHFELGGVVVTYAQATIIALSVMAVAALYALFRFTRVGIAMRAVVDSSELVGLHGMRPRVIQRVSWMIGSTFAALSGVLLAPLVGIHATAMTFLVVQAFGAAAVGGFSSIPLTYLGGLVLGVLSSFATKYVLEITWLTGLPAALPFIVLVVVLVMLPERRLSAPRGSEKPLRLPWTGAPRLRVLAAIPVLLLFLALPHIVGLRLPYFSTGLALAIIILSLGLLVRTAGIISLCHAAFAAIGAVAYAQLVEDLGVPTIAAMLLAALVVVPIAALLALPAMRLSGLFLSLATLGFGLMLEQIFYPTSLMFTSEVAGRAMPRPSFAESDQAYYYFVLAAFVLVAGGMVVLHQSRLGRLLRGMGESSTAMSTLGTDLNVTRLLTFCVSGFVAAIGGILYGCGVHFAVLGDANFSAFSSLVLVATLAVMPFREPWYGVFAALAAFVPAYWQSPTSPYWLNVLFGVFAVMVACQGGTAPMPVRLGSYLHRKFPHRQFVPSATRVGTKAHGRAMPPGGEGLEVASVTVRYGGNTALDNVTIAAPLGTITGVIGPNGAGKTTLFNAVSGLVRPASGAVSFRGVDLTRQDVAARARAGIGRTFQTMQLCNALTVADNVLLGYEAGRGGNSFRHHLYGGPGERNAGHLAASEAMELCGITHLAAAQAGSLSTGQRRLVELARCLAGRFDLLLLDEPSSGLDGVETERFGDLLEHVVRERGCGLLLVEHDMSLVMRVCSNLYVLDFGSLIFSGTPAEVAASPDVAAAYLGAAALDLGGVS